MINLKIMKTETNFKTITPENTWSKINTCISPGNLTRDKFYQINFHWKVINITS